MRRERLRRDVHERRPRSDRRNRQKRVNARPPQRHAQEDSGTIGLETLTGEALAKANAETEKRRPEFEQQLASIVAEIARAEQSLERYYEAFEQAKLSPERCEARLQRLQARLDDLRAQEAELSLAAPDEGTHAPTPADLAANANLLEEVLAEADPQKAKPLLRLLIDELRVNGRAEILPTYRLITPTACAMSERVGRAGIEPATLGLKVRPDKLRLAARNRNALQIRIVPATN